MFDSFTDLHVLTNYGYRGPWLLTAGPIKFNTHYSTVRSVRFADFFDRGVTNTRRRDFDSEPYGRAYSSIERRDNCRSHTNAVYRSSRPTTSMDRRGVR